MSVTIVGAGMAGLLAANMLQHRGPILLVEEQPELPNNHSAVLRFRSPVIGDVLGMPFRKVQLIKTSVPWRNPVADALAYSYKNLGVRRSDRSISDGVTTAERYIAPADFIERMAQRLPPKDIFLGSQSSFASDGPFISTIPMPSLMAILDYQGAHSSVFTWRNSVNVRATVAECDAYASVMVPDPDRMMSRVSITGNELIVECPGRGLSSTPIESAIRFGAHYLGLEAHAISDASATMSTYAKILPIDEAIRRDFLHWATDKHNIFSLGRFATWRPGLLLDDLVQDIRLIDSWISTPDRYSIARRK